MKKANKSLAVDWNKEQEKIAQDKEYLEEQINLLWYAGTKRDSGFPSASMFESLGFPEIATMLRQAYDLLEKASDIMQQTKA